MLLASVPLQVVDRMKDKKFDNLLAAELQKQKVQVKSDSLSVETVSFKEVMTTTLLAGLGLGGFLGGFLVSVSSVSELFSMQV